MQLFSFMILFELFSFKITLPEEKLLVSLLYSSMACQSWDVFQFCYVLFEMRQWQCFVLDVLEITIKENGADLFNGDEKLFSS